MVRLYFAWRTLPGRSAGSRALSISRVLAAKLFILVGALPYVRQTVDTLRLVFHYKPSTVVVELPQGPLLFLAVILKLKFRFKLIVDVHTGFLVYDSWKGYVLNKPFAFFLRFADIIIVHNVPILSLLPDSLKAKVMVVYDPPRFTPQEEVEENYILLPVSWREDEPIMYVLNEFTRSNIPYKLVVTGDYNKRRSVYERFKHESKIVFTGYVSERKYLSILSKAKAVIAVTAREYTLTSSGWEAIYAGKIPIISETMTLKELFKDNAVYFKLVRGSLAGALESLRDPETLKHIKRGVVELRRHLLRETVAQLGALVKIVKRIEGEASM